MASTPATTTQQLSTSLMPPELSLQAEGRSTPVQDEILQEKDVWTLDEAGLLIMPDGYHLDLEASSQNSTPQPSTSSETVQEDAQTLSTHPNNYNLLAAPPNQSGTVSEKVQADIYALPAHPADKDSSNEEIGSNPEALVEPKSCKRRRTSTIPLPPICINRDTRSKTSTSAPLGFEQLLKEMEERITKQIGGVRSEVHKVGEEVDCLKEYCYELTASLATEVAQAGDRLDQCIKQGIQPAQRTREAIIRMAADLENFG